MLLVQKQGARYNRFNVVGTNRNAQTRQFELAQDTRPIKPRINCQYEDLCDKDGNQLLGAGLYIEMFDINKNASVPGTQDGYADFYGNTPKINQAKEQMYDL